jgi:hypothetical protein
MNQNLVEYKGQTYNNGLTIEEKAYLNALEQTQIQDSTLPMFKALIAKGIVISGIKDLPSAEETQLLYDTTQQHYRYMTISELGLAFQLNAVGQSWKRVEHYGLMSIQFLSDVLNAYKIYKMQMNLDIDKKKARLIIEASTEDSEPMDIKEMIVNDIQRWKENKREAVLVLAPTMMRKLEEKNIINAEWWSDDDWKKFRFCSYQQLTNERNLSNFAITRMKSSDKSEFELSIRQGIMRYLYADIMDSHILQQKIFSKL